MIEVSGLNKHIVDQTSELRILSDIDLYIEQGQSLAILGPSGSGKSTLLALLAGLDIPSSGQVQILGTDIFALDEDARAVWRAQNMGFVFQNFQLLGHMTALENVSLPLELLGITNAKERAKAMLERVGLGQRIEQYPKVLSGGEQQRIALARAFVVKPKILLADEPTGSLDRQTGDGVIGLMSELKTENGCTLILVTHDLKMAELCSKQIHLEGGRVRSESKADTKAV